jgi:hypothetical protein
LSKKNDILEVLKSHSDAAWEGDLSAQWDAVESRLDRRRAWMAWWWVPLAGALLLGALFLYQSVRDVQPPTQTTVVQSPETKNTDPRQTSPEGPTDETEGTENADNRDNNIYPEIGSDNTGGTGNLSSDDQIRNQDPKNTTDEVSNGQEPLVLNFKQLKGIGYAADHNFDLTPVLEQPEKPVSEPFVYQARPEIGISTSPGWMLRQLTSNNALLNRSFLGKVDGKVNASMGYQLGVQVKLPIANRWVIHTGLGVSSMAESVEFNHQIDSAPVLNASNDAIVGYIPVAPALREEVKHSGINSYRYLSIPLAVQYRLPIGDKGWVLAPEIGGSVWLTPTQQGFEVDPTYLSLIDLNQNLITTETVLLTTSVSVRYETQNKWSIEAAPFYNRMMLSAYQKQYPVKNKPYIYGINVGVNYTLGK